MSYSASKIECLRFAGRKGGEGIGCCAIDMFQGFSNDPDAKRAVQLFHGDSQTPLNKDGKTAWLGTTNREIFEQYLRIGTFDLQEMPNRMFLAAMTDEQLETTYGAKWLAILKENGFKFIMSTDNSVYSGQAADYGDEPPNRDDWTYIESECGCCGGHWEDANGNYMGDEGSGGEEAHPVHLFGLVRNIGVNRLDDPFKAPRAWEDLPEPSKSHLDIWKEGSTKILSEAEATGKSVAEITAAAPAVVKSPW